MSQGQIDQDQVAALINATREQGGGVETNMTKTVHRALYPAIDPIRPKLSQKGRTILITGAGTGIGLAIAKAFAQAGALRIIITGRRSGVLEDAQKKIEADAQQFGTNTEVLVRPSDVSDRKAVAALWEDLENRAIEVDVLVLNAAKMISDGGLGPLSNSTVDDIWNSYETNVLGPLSMAAWFDKQNLGRYKNIVNISTQSIVQFRADHNIIAYMNPAYALSKNAGTFLNQVIAEHANPEKLQVVNLHPGLIHSAELARFGVTSDMLPFDDVSLPGAAAVYLASPQAKFLHGRFVFASWDVDELKTGELRSMIDEDAEFLKIGVHGIGGDGNRKW